MITNDNRIKQILSETATHLGEGPAAGEIHRQQEMLLRTIEHVKQTEHRQFRPIKLAFIAAAAVLVVSISVGVLLHSPTPLSFTVGDAGVAGELSSWLAPSNQQPLPIAFQGGSTILLKKDASARVLEANTDRVRVSLHSGTVFASIKGNGHTKWSIFAGPYEVKVIGTQFFVDWNQSLSALQVRVTEGIVLVTGRGLGEQGVSVERGNQLTADSKAKSFTVSPTVQPVHLAAPSASIDADADQTATDASTAPAKGAKAKRVNKKPRWKQLYEERKYKAAVAAWTTTNHGSYKTLDKIELWNLANAARYAKNAPVAKEALLTLRKQFPTSKQAEAAVFLLGKNALELSSNATEATRRFEQYLRQYPTGPMAEKATGRLIQIYKRQGQTAKAKTLANKYLSTYPNGSFAKLAASVHTK